MGKLGPTPEWTVVAARKKEIFMTDLLRLPIKLAITIALCFFISNCGIPIETSKGTFTIDSLSKEERRRNHQDPSRMAEELEHDRRAEISKDIRKQNIKENSATEVAPIIETGV